MTFGFDVINKIYKIEDRAKLVLIFIRHLVSLVNPVPEDLCSFGEEL